MIFINYRIKDSKSEAIFLERDLKRIFGETLVFRDKTGIEGGDRWREVILQNVTDCCVMLVLIGTAWEDAKFESGKQKKRLRLEDPEDWVRLEISTALAQKKIVIPILLDGTPMPDREWLESFQLEGLSDAQGTQFRIDDHEHDFGKLVTLLRKKCPQLPQEDLPANPQLPLTPTTISRAYSNWLIKQCADIVPFAMEPTQGLSVSLQEVYVPLLTNPPFDPQRGISPKSGIGTGETLPDAPPSLAPESDENQKPQLLLSLLGTNSLYVSGDPGTGKTTFCRWLAWLTMTGEEPKFTVEDPEFHETLPDSLRGKLPVLVRLRELGHQLPQVRLDSDGQQPNRPPLAGTRRWCEAALQDWVTQAAPGGLSWNDIASHLAAGSLLLILDGVDELPLSGGPEWKGSSPRELFLEALYDATPAWIQLGNRILITSRPYGLEPDQVRQLERAGIPEARLVSLPEGLQKLLATRWFVALPKTSTDGRKTAEAMLEEARGLSEDLAVMMANPLLLTAICVIYSSGKVLPQDRHHLYDRIIDTALYSRFRRDKTRIAQVRGRLAAIALGMHSGEPIEPGRKSPAREVHYTELDQILADFIENNPETESGGMGVVSAREELLNNSGLLLSTRSKFAAFSHWSFQEFLAAERMTTLCHANEDRLFEQICQRSPLTGWRPTLLFLFDRRVSQLGWQSGTPLLKRMVGEIEQKSLANSLGLATCAADALGILLDLKLQLQEELLAPFRQICLAAIDQGIELKARVDLARALGRIGDPRIATDLRDRANWVQEPPTWVTVDAEMYPIGDAKILGDGKNQYSLKAATYSVDQPFLLSRFPVTNQQFEAFIQAGGYQNPAYWIDTAGDRSSWEWRESENIVGPRLSGHRKWAGPTQPVVGVSWFEAMAYCRWAHCRFPTEREWEAAARGPKGWQYPWGDVWREGICNTAEAQFSATTPVGTFKDSQSSCGAYDMAGNVWEWCEDLWNPEDQNRVVRGGSWYYNSGVARSAFRDWLRPVSRIYDVGFRVVALRLDS